MTSQPTRTARSDCWLWALDRKVMRDLPGWTLLAYLAGYCRLWALDRKVKRDLPGWTLLALGVRQESEA